MTWIDPQSVYWDDWLLLAVQIATLVALVLYVWKTWEMARATREAAESAAAAVLEARDSRLEALAPRVIVYFDGTPNLSAQIVIQNAGAGTAQDVMLSFDPELQATEHEEFLQFFRIPQSVLPPGYRIAQIFDVWPAYLASTLPRQYVVTVRYHGAENGRAYETTQRLSVEEWRLRLAPSRQDDLMREVQRSVDRGVGYLERLAKTASEWHSYSAMADPTLSVIDSRQHLVRLWRAVRTLNGDSYMRDWIGFLGALRTQALHTVAACPPADSQSRSAIASVQVLAVLYRVDSDALGNNDWLAAADRIFEELGRASA